jgi:hypothetical protein
VIKTTGLRKSFQTRGRKQSAAVDAVRGIDLSVAEGEIFGFLGPNGAGKTTTLRMLATLLPPDGGEAVIFGANLRTDPAEVRRRIGYVAQLRRHHRRGHRARGTGDPGPRARDRQGRGARAGAAGDRRVRAWASTPTGSARPTPAASAAGWTSRSA